jgi:hypothetical protein
MMRATRRVARRVLTYMGAVAILTPMAVGMTSSSARAATPIGNEYYELAEGFDTCAHPTDAGLSDWWNDTPWYAYGYYLGGDGGAYVGCTPVSLSVLDHAVNLGFGVVPFWYGPQLPGACGGTNEYTIPLDNNTADEEDGIAQAEDATVAAENADYDTYDTIYLDVEGFDNNAGCVTAEEWYVFGWDAYMYVYSPYAPAMYGSTCSSYLNDIATMFGGGDAVPQDIVAADPNNNPEIFNLECLSNSYWVNYQRDHQFTNPITLKYGGYSLPIDEECVDTLIDTNATVTVIDPSGCSHIT